MTGRGAGGFRHVAFAEIGSTNAEALDRARSGDPGGLWITAERQVAGRGRRGRPWVSDKGNLYASVLLVEPCEAALLGQLPFVAVVAAHRAVAEAAGPAAGEVTIKWPNDLIFRGRKMTGILLEASRLATGVQAVAVGFGINCVHYPAVSETPATSLLQEGVSIFPERLFTLLAEAFAEALATWDRGRGFAEIRRRWLAAARGIGAAIKVRLVDREIDGIFEAIDADGRLVLKTSDGSRMTISAGDVFFAPQMEGGR